MLEYRIPRGTIAFDEIIDGIELVIEDTSGHFGFVSIDTNQVNLNPNSATLSYCATLYHPGSDYVAQLRLYGNYE